MGLWGRKSTSRENTLCFLVGRGRGGVVVQEVEFWGQGKKQSCVPYTFNSLGWFFFLSLCVSSEGGRWSRNEERPIKTEFVLLLFFVAIFSDV